MMQSVDAIPGAMDVLAELKSFRGRVPFGFKPPDRIADRNLRLCNLVLQGGGVLGLGHVGFIIGLEQAGFRFAGLAGTSAGAIVATGIACIRGDNIQRAVGQDLLRVVSSMPMSSFVDASERIKALIYRVTSGENLYTIGNLPSLAIAAYQLLRYRGLNSGDAFEDWLEETFRNFGVSSNRQLLYKLEKIDGSLKSLGVDVKALDTAEINKELERENQPRPATPDKSNDGVGAPKDEIGKPEDGRKASRANANKFKTEPQDWLKIISSALPSGIKFFFPRDLDQLDPTYLAQSPAIFVRASMAIPMFFRPKYLNSNKKAWEQRVDGFFENLASQGQRDDFKRVDPIAFVDGGLFSNLALDAFDGIKGVPTIALTLVDKGENPEYRFRPNAGGFLDDAWRLFDAVRLQRDRDALDRQEGQKLRQVWAVDTCGVNWLNFDLSDDDKEKLVLSGMKSARDFLATRK